MRQGQIPDYTKEYQTATHMVQALYKSQPANEIMQRQIYTWFKHVTYSPKTPIFVSRKTGNFQPSSPGTTLTHTCASSNISSYTSGSTQMINPSWKNRNLQPTECSLPGKKCASECSKRTPSQSQNASGTTNSSTPKEEKTTYGEASFTAPLSKCGDTLVKKERTTQVRADREKKATPEKPSAQQNPKPRKETPQLLPPPQPQPASNDLAAQDQN